MGGERRRRRRHCQIDTMASLWEIASSSPLCCPCCRKPDALLSDVFKSFGLSYPPSVFGQVENSPNLPQFIFRWSPLCYVRLAVKSGARASGRIDGPIAPSPVLRRPSPASFGRSFRISKLRFSLIRGRLQQCSVEHNQARL